MKNKHWKMPLNWVLAFATIVWVPSAVALTTMAPQESAALQEKDSNESPKQKIDGIIATFEANMAEFMEVYRGANPEDRQKLIAEKMPKSASYAGKLMELVTQHPDDPAAVDALLWIVSRARDTEEGKQALAMLLQDHMADQRLTSIVMNLTYNTPGPDIESNLQQIISNSPHDSVKGLATYGLAQYLSRVDQYKEFLEDPRMAGSLSEENIRYIKNFKPDQAKQEALYQTIVDQYGEVLYQNRMLGKMAEGALFAIRYLSVGKTVPEIEGTDLDGEAFKLSDYRGKVVVLDFWGDW